MTDWDRRFIDLAQHVSTWSKDPSTQVGAVIVDANRRVVSVGFNGFPRGVGDDERMQNRATKYEMTVHAEVNALMFANRGVDGCTVYVWPIPPCARCAAQLIQAGIARVVSPPPTERWVESCSLGTAMLAEAEVEIDQIPGVETIPDDAILVDNDAPPFRLETVEGLLRRRVEQPAEFETVPPSLPLLEETHQKLIRLKERNRVLGKQVEDQRLLILQLRKQIERDAAQAALDDTKIRDQAVELAVLRGQVKERENRLTHIEMLRKHTKVLEQDHVAEQATLRKECDLLRKQLDQSERISTARQDDLRASNAMLNQQLARIEELHGQVGERDRKLVEMSGHLEGARKRGNSLQFMISARQQELERQNADLVAANNKLLERARVAENKVVVLERSNA